MTCEDCGSNCHATVVNTAPASVLCCKCDMGGCPRQTKLRLTTRGWVVIGIAAWVLTFVILNLLMPWDTIWVKTK